MFESLVEWKNGTVSTDIHLQAEISGSMPRVVLRESNLTNNRRMFNVEIDNLAEKPYIPHKSLL